MTTRSRLQESAWEDQGQARIVGRGVQRTARFRTDEYLGIRKFGESLATGEG